MLGEQSHKIIKNKKNYVELDWPRRKKYLTPQRVTKTHIAYCSLVHGHQHHTYIAAAEYSSW